LDYSILNTIKNPDDVKKLNDDQVELLCGEIRDCIINTVSKNGGHLASNLGCVELTVALHRAFSSPEDAIIFDVGHQSYTHKLLTGRFEAFSTLRTKNGISGFMKPSESEHDPFITGHSSNSISAALGIYKAKRLENEDGTAVAVIGDGAMTGGMAYEALNNAGNITGNFIVVLNDNKMSISKNVGSFSRALTKMRNRKKYHSFKFAVSKFLLKIPFIGKWLNKVIYSIKEFAKLLVYRRNIFSSLGFNYLGPVSGHDIKAMTDLFNVAKTYDKPSLIHVISTKGKGYKYAEENPNNYHGVASFDINEGAGSVATDNFSFTAGETLISLATGDRRICAVTAAMTEGTGLSFFAEKFADRFFDVGIAEQHAVTFASGLAAGGMKPYFLVYSTFLQRGFDQIIHDAAIANLPIKLLIDRAGVVGEDGETHQGIFDVSYLTLIPNMNVYSPSTYNELAYRIIMSSKSDELEAIRYPRGSEPKLDEFDFKGDFTHFNNGNKVLIITYGRLFAQAMSAFEEYPHFDILKLNKIYPISDETVSIVLSYQEVYFFEEAVKSGSVSEHLSARLLEKGFKGSYNIHAIENSFVPAGSIKELISDLGLSKDTMLSVVKGSQSI